MLNQEILSSNGGEQEEGEVYRRFSPNNGNSKEFRRGCELPDNAIFQKTGIIERQVNAFEQGLLTHIFQLFSR